MSTLTRERNFDLIRLILMELEKSPLDSVVTNSDLKIEGYDPLQIAFHVEMLADASFIEAKIPKVMGGMLSDFIVKKILWAGYEFLDNAKNNTI